MVQYMINYRKMSHIQVLLVFLYHRFAAIILTVIFVFHSLHLMEWRVQYQIISE